MFKSLQVRASSLRHSRTARRNRTRFPVGPRAAEVLEDRRLLSCTAVQQDETLVVQGDAADNRVEVSYDAGTAEIVCDGGDLQTFSGITAVTAATAGGDDVIDLNVVPGVARDDGRPAEFTVLAGAGDNDISLDVVGVGTPPIGGGGGGGQPSTLFGSDVLDDGLITIDTGTGTATFVGPYPGVPHGAIGGLAYDSNTETLYGIDATTASLVTIDPTTGAATTVGPAGVAGASTGLAFDPNSGTLYAADSVLNRKLYTVNTSTGAGTEIGSFMPDLGVGRSIGALAFDPHTNTLYGVDGGSVSVGTNTSDTLYTIDTTTAALTAVGPLGVAGDSSGLAFDSDTGWPEHCGHAIEPARSAARSASVCGPPSSTDP